jgi:hypothetical protein
MGAIFKIFALLLLLAGAFVGWCYYSTGHLPIAQWRAYTARIAPALNAENLPISSDASGKLTAGVKQLLDKVSDAPAEMTSSQVKVYKWKDAKGVVHFDNHPVAGAQEINVDTKTNTIPSVGGASADAVTEPKEKSMSDETNELRAAKQKHDEQKLGI